MTNEREAETFLWLAEEAAARANSTSESWLRLQWLEIAGAYCDCAERRMKSTLPGTLISHVPQEGGGYQRRG